MSSIRNSRTRLLTAATTLVVAALSLTACSDGTGARDEGASTSSFTDTAHSADDPTSPASTPSDHNTSTGNKKSATANPKPAANTTAENAPASTGKNKTVTCEGSNTKVVAAPLNRPVNHMLLTVTNTGSNTCYLYGYPAIRFDDAQAVPPVIKDSQPQAVVTLNPGESGYASVNLSASDGNSTHGSTQKSLTLYFQGRSGNESTGTAAHPPLPTKGLYTDDSLKVTYWQQSMDDAISW